MTKRPKIYNVKEKASSGNDAGLTVSLYVENIPIFLLYPRLKSKWIKHCNVKPDTLNLIEEKVGNSLVLLGTRENFLERTLMTQALRSRFDKWDLMKLKICKAKNIVNRTNWQPTEKLH